eukprot:TRINITY_DN1302_c0_g1_i1.p2 TRINITY_DN1302_c0_g1~~TRINITY_DN1302_c0_g1_i1.p2  ORF type:complete len:109 (-),score=30.15 TRINITY_DN1302_c0_g1_i1:194-520(-)
MRQEPTIFIWDVDDGTECNDSPDPVAKLIGHEGKINQAVWGPLNETIFSCSDDGTVRIWNPEARKEISKVQAHDMKINVMSFSKDFSHFITASADQTSKMYDLSLIPI